MKGIGREGDYISVIHVPASFAQGDEQGDLVSCTGLCTRQPALATPNARNKWREDLEQMTLNGLGRQK